MSKPFHPMLAARDIILPEHLHTLQYPIYGTPKKDGIRAQVFPHHRIFSRKHITIPNCFIEEWCHDNEIPPGCDGELVVQGRFGDENFNECQSKIMSTYSIPFEWKYYVFDQWFDGEAEDDPGYRKRFATIANQIQSTHYPKVELLKPVKLKSVDDVLEYEHQQVDIQCEEGIILRSPKGVYKQGRCTLNEQLMLKMKRFEEREAIIIDFVERKHNANPQTRDNVGAAKRSKHKANMQGTGLLGAFIGRDLEDGTEFKCGGFTEAFARKVWANKMDYYEKIFTYSKQIHGELNKPRSPQFKGMRSLADL